MTRREAVYIRVFLIVVMMIFVAVMAVNHQHVWAGIGFVMALIASLSPVKSDEGAE